MFFVRCELRDCKKYCSTFILIFLFSENKFIPLTFVGLEKSMPLFMLIEHRVCLRGWGCMCVRVCEEKNKRR